MKVKEAKERSSAFRPDRKREKQSENDRPLMSSRTLPHTHNLRPSLTPSLTQGMHIAVTEALEWLSQEVS
jgi:hypothetical protein